MPLLQVSYISRPFGFDSAMLGGILMDARRCNMRDGITGALICRADMYLQLLEGPVEAVEFAFARINRDDRHMDVRPLTRGAIASDARLFPNWAMRDDPAQSWVWTRTELDDGAADRATEAEVIGIFTRLAAIDLA
jgi:hypothetical protein